MVVARAKKAMAVAVARAGKSVVVARAKKAMAVAVAVAGKTVVVLGLEACGCS